MMNTFFIKRQFMKPSAQSGVVIYVAMVALVVMSLAAVALIRTLGASNSVSANIAFRQASTQAADIGVNLAFNALQTKIVPGNANKNTAPYYYSLLMPVDANGVPNPNAASLQKGAPGTAGTGPGVWGEQPCYDTSGKGLLLDCSDESQYRVQYVIDRQCTTTNVPTDCLNAKTPIGQQGKSQNANAATFPAPTKILYRVTVKVSGPRNTYSFVQAAMTF